jgi:hypothetical protein
LFIVLQLIDDIIRDNISIGSKNQINLIVGKRQQGCWHMAAMLSAYASNRTIPDIGTIKT